MRTRGLVRVGRGVVFCEESSIVSHSAYPLPPHPPPPSPSPPHHDTAEREMTRTTRGGIMTRRKVVEDRKEESRLTIGE
jgi:hypothetical protein